MILERLIMPKDKDENEENVIYLSEANQGTISGSYVSDAQLSVDRQRITFHSISDLSTFGLKDLITFTDSEGNMYRMKEDAVLTPEEYTMFQAILIQVMICGTTHHMARPFDHLKGSGLIKHFEIKEIPNE